MDDLEHTYRSYIDCLNRRDWEMLKTFVAANVRYNGEDIGLAGYRDLLEGNFRDIPDLRFEIGLLVIDASSVAARLIFDCHPSGAFLGLDVNGRRIVFAENVIYEFVDERIAVVWSVVDKAAIEDQLGERSSTRSPD